MKKRAIEHHDNWETPKWLYDKLNQEFNFDFDPCPLNHNVDLWDGLKVKWGASNFINPPYSQRLKEAFIKKAIGESKMGKLCVMLLPVSTSTIIFHEFVQPNAKEIRFLKGRVRFKGVNSKGEYTEKTNGMHDSMIVVFCCPTS